MVTVRVEILELPRPVTPPYIFNRSAIEGGEISNLFGGKIN